MNKSILLLLTFGPNPIIEWQIAFAVAREISRHLSGLIISIARANKIFFPSNRLIKF